MLDKFQETFFIRSACDENRRLVERCNIGLSKERKIEEILRNQYC